MEEGIKHDIIKQLEYIKEYSSVLKPLVVIRCVTYNHEPYIRDALEGFVTQRTNFPFVAIVHDDASTDKTAEIIKEYAEKYPNIILPIYEHENQHSKGQGTISRILNPACLSTGAKYIAMCEGDDYWTDPLKLQKQVDFMEAHPEYSMCFTNCIAKNYKGEEVYRQNNYPMDRDAPMEDLILNGGAFCATNTILYRLSSQKNMPLEARMLYVGDYPLQMYLGYVGKVRYLNDVTAIYRYARPGSWSSTIQNCSFENRVKEVWPKNEHLFNTMDKVTEYNFTELMRAAMFDFMFWDCRRYGKYLMALKLWPRLYRPLKRHGFKALFEILGYGFMRSKLKQLLRHKSI